MDRVAVQVDGVEGGDGGHASHCSSRHGAKWSVIRVTTIEPVDQSWAQIELRHLLALDAVARTGSFRGAADDLGYSLSALSGQVATLERLVGQRLVDRPGGRRPVSITPAGHRLLEHATDLSARMTAARADLERLRAGRPALRLGLYQSVAVRLLPALVGELGRRRPDLALELVERVDDGALLDGVGGGELDVTFVALPVTPGPFATAHLLDEPYVVLVAADGPLGDRTTIATSELAAHPMIDYGELRSVHHPRMRLPRAERPTVVMRSDDHPTIHALVAAGIGIAILPRLSVDPHDPRVRALEPTPAPDPRRIGLAWHRDRRPDGLDDLVAAATASATIT